jgi:hypothetical protein
MAGHPVQVGCFEIRRAAVAPPSVLLSLILPELDIWKDRFGLNPGQINDLAATGLTNLLFYLREVILQDSVMLRSRFPDNAVWTHPVFQHAAYEPYAREVAKQLYEGESENQLSRLYQALPQLVDYLKAMEARDIQRTAEIKALVDTAALQASEAARTAQAAYAAAQQAPLQLLVSGGLTLRLDTPVPAPALTSIPAPALTLSINGSMSRYASARAN